MDKIQLEHEIERYKSLIQLHEAKLHNAKHKIERSIQRDIVDNYEAILSKLISIYMIVK